MRRRVVDVHADAQRRHTPEHVLVFCWFDGGVIWVRHPIRGWEVPGGKVEQGETPEEAARREVMEEAGAVLGPLTWVGEYALGEGDEADAVSYKWVFTASVQDVAARPSFSEMMDVCVSRPPWAPDEVLYRPDVSFVMKDEAFATLWPSVRAPQEEHGEGQDGLRAR